MPVSSAAPSATASANSAASAQFLAAPLHKAELGDATLAWRSFGSGPDLLFIHGFPLHGYTWRKLLPALQTGFTCHVVDLAGKGESDWNAQTDFGFTAHAHRLKLLADHLGLARYAIVAQDTGATVARCLAREDPARVSRMALINTEMPGHRPPWIREYQWLMKVPGTELAFRQLLRSRLFLESGMGLGGCFEDMRTLDADFHAHFIAPYIASARRTDGMARYLKGIDWKIVDTMAQWHREMRMPVLLLWGERDPTFPVELGRVMARQFPDCRFIGIPGTRLLPHEEKPDVVTRHLGDFLGAP